MPTRQPPAADTGDSRLALFEELRRAERRALSSQVAAAIAHMIGTPLHVIAGRASLIQGAPEDASVADNARRIEDQVHKLSQRIRALIDHITVPEGMAKQATLTSVVENALELYRPIAEARGVRFEVSNRAAPETSVDEDTALIVLSNLLSLAARVAPKGAICPLEVAVTEEGRAELLLGVPGLEPPVGRIDSLEPPEKPEKTGREEWQILVLSAVVARRSGGKLEVRGSPGQATIRYLAERSA